MIHDAKVEVTCDGEHCQESIDIEPSWVYASWNENSGFYDCSESAIEKKLIAEGWDIGKNGTHLCEGCKEEANGH